MSLLKPNGKIIAVVPNSVMLKLSKLPEGYSLEVEHDLKETFDGTGELNISIITIHRVI